MPATHAGKSRRQLLDALDHRLQILEDALDAVRRPSPDTPSRMRRNIFRLRRSTSASVAAAALVSRRVSAISASLAEHGAGPAVPIDDALAILLAEQADAGR